MISTVRLWLTADRSEVVADGDARAAYLLAGVGSVLDAATVSRYRLHTDGKTVVGPTMSQPAARQDEAAPAATKHVAGPRPRAKRK